MTDAERRDEQPQDGWTVDAHRVCAGSKARSAGWRQRPCTARWTKVALQCASATANPRIPVRAAANHAGTKHNHQYNQSNNDAHYRSSFVSCPSSNITSIPLAVQPVNGAGRRNLAATCHRPRLLGALPGAGKPTNIRSRADRPFAFLLHQCYRPDMPTRIAMKARSTYGRSTDPSGG